MGKFNVDQISKMTDPYQELVAADALAEHLNDLNQLDKKNMQQVVSRMVILCPDNKLAAFHKKKEALHVYSDSEKDSAFYNLLRAGLEIRGRINGLLDERNPKPYKLLTGHNFNADQYNQFDSLFFELTKGKEITVATRLVQTLPEGSENELARNIRSIAEHSSMAETLGAALELKKSIKTKLLSDHPDQFFQRGFSHDQCHQFSSLVYFLIKDNEREIGRKLATAPDEHLRNDIAKKLEQLCSTTESDNPFKKIAHAFNQDAERLQKKVNEKKIAAQEQHGLFASRSTTVKEDKKDNTTDVNEEDSHSRCPPCIII